VNKSELHRGELKSTEPSTEGSFEFGGHKIPLAGTSGPRPEQSRLAEGKPIRGNAPGSVSHPQIADLFEFGGLKLKLSGTSGPAKEPPRVAEGMPVRAGAPARQVLSTASLTGSGSLMSGPVRRT
jgi:hypothetical protein